MARIGSGDGWDCPTWGERENPGAGSQDFTNFSDKGLNGWFKRIWRGLKLVLNPDGTMKDAVVDYNNLKTTVADGSTVEVAGSPAKIRVRDGGIGSTQLATGAVTSAKVASGAISGSSQIANGVIGSAHFSAGAVNAAAVAADAINAGHITHDNNRTKFTIPYSIPANDAYATIGGVACSATLGFPMPRAGSITKVISCNNGGTVESTANAYGTDTFAANAKLTILHDSSARDTIFYVNGVEVVRIDHSANNAPYLGVIECEFDD